MALPIKGCARPPAGTNHTITGAAIGPHGNTLYLATRERGAILAFLILKSSRLKFLDCISYHGLRGCDPAPGDHLHRPFNLKMSPSGRTFFVNLTNSPTLERYDLNSAGELDYTGCLSEDPDESQCQTVNLFPANITLAAISGDGESYYFGSGGNWQIFGPAD